MLSLKKSGDKMNLDKKLIGIRIMQRRKEHGLTQEQLSEELGVSKNHLSSIERGVYVPTTQLLFQICNTLGETPDFYLIGKLTEEISDIPKLIQQMPAEAQTITRKLIETYLDAIRYN